LSYPYGLLVGELFNLIVDLDDGVAVTRERARSLAGSVNGVNFVASDAASETVLAWIDEEFGGCWSSEAHAASNALAFRDGSPAGFAAFDPQGLRFAWLRGVAREPGVGVFGPFGVAASQRGKGIGRALLQFALAGLRELGYARALIAGVGEERLGYYGEALGARVVERFDRAALVAPRARVVVMASGNGTNLQAVLDGVGAGTLPIELVGVVVNNPQARAIERARNAGVSPTVIPWQRKDEPRQRYDARLLSAVSALRPDLVLLLGWMHLLDEPFVRAFPNLLNLHPAYLPLDPQRDDVGMPDGTTIPAFRGAFAVRDALGFGSQWTGASVHAVTPATDRGPILVRKPLRVQPGEDEAAVLMRLHPLEHRLVAAAVMRHLYER
jgi:phosphoribosylglycinamide formyltransferase-1